MAENIFHKKLIENAKIKYLNERPLLDWYVATAVNFLSGGFYYIFMIYSRFKWLNDYIERKANFFVITADFLADKNIDNSKVIYLKNLIMEFKGGRKNAKFYPALISILLVLFTVMIMFLALYYLFFILENEERYGSASYQYKDLFYFILYIFIFTAVFIFLLLFYTVYRVLYIQNRMWYNVQVVESKLFREISDSLISLGLIDKPVDYKIIEENYRPYAKNIIISILTFFIWMFVWDKRIHESQNKVMDVTYKAESEVISAVNRG